MIGIDLIANGVVAVLLAVTIGFAFVLNRRLQLLRQNQGELLRLATALNQATARAQEGIYELKAVGQTTEETLKREVGRARALADELALITEAGNNLADKLEAGLTRRAREAADDGRRPHMRVAGGLETLTEAAANHDERRHALKTAR